MLKVIQNIFLICRIKKGYILLNLFGIICISLLEIAISNKEIHIIPNKFSKMYPFFILQIKKMFCITFNINFI